MKFRLTGEEERVGGFDLIYKNNKRVKNGGKNMSMLGCVNDRLCHMRKMAKIVALKQAERPKEGSSNNNGNNGNQRGRSTFAGRNLSLIHI